MNAKGKDYLIAGIELGPNALSMKIAEVSGNSGIKLLENLRHPISIGEDTFSIGKVSFEILTETCEIIKGFKKLMADYKIEQYRAIATVAVREASNRDYIVDQIKLKTGISIETVENSIERYYSLDAVKTNLKNFDAMRNEGCIIADVGYGSIQISILSGGKLEESLNVRMGTLRIKEMLSVLEGKTLNFPQVMEEFITGKIDTINFSQYQDSFKNIVLIGGDVKIIGSLINQIYLNNKGKEYILKDDFDKIYNEFLYKPDSYIKTKFNLPHVSAEILMPTLMIFRKFLEITKSDRFYIPMIAPLDGLLIDMVRVNSGIGEAPEFEKDIISQAHFIAQKYQYDRLHAEDVEKKSLALFDGTRKLHGLGKRERLLLQAAAILHDTGKFISLNSHYMHSYNIIMASEILGISLKEKEIIANIAKYHSTLIPEESHPDFSRLDNKSKLTIAKLTAIIRMADSLDRSHKQKISDIKVSFDKDRLVVKADTTKDTLLEQWTFEDKAEFFKTVFGVAPEIKSKREMLNVH